MPLVSLAVPLTDLCPPRHDGLPGQQLSQDAPCAPQVHSHPVVGGAKQQLRRPIPQSDHAASQRNVLFWPIERSQSKIRNFQGPLVVEQEIGTLDVAVEDTVSVAVLQPAHQLLHVALDLGSRQQHTGEPHTGTSHKECHLQETRTTSCID